MKKSWESEDRRRISAWLGAKQGVLTALVFGFVLLAAAWSMTRDWNKPLLDMHSFRQTQTAMSAYYMAEDAGMFFDYITPVLGKPWQIPMEVPIYQWIVARWHNLSGMGLDQSGKFISIVFWLACLVPIWRLLGLLDFSVPQRCIASALLYSSPLYLYWGRSFMIETTGLFLSIGMAACVCAGYKRHDWRWLLAGLALGIGAALCKVTTWAVAGGVTGLLILFSDGLPKWQDWKWIVGAGALTVVPILPAKLWLHYGDSIKQLNPFAKELIVSTSSHQAAWNFGTFEQKLDPATWLHIWRHITDQLLVPFPGVGPFFMVLVLVAGAVASPKRIPVILIFLAGFASGPIIFTNLYFEHSYYWSANGVWLLLAVGTALAGIWECRPGKAWPQVVALALALTMVISGFVAWNQRFLPVLKSLPTAEQLDEAWRKPVQAIVPPERTILILGNDWNPTALYYAQRKGIAFPLRPEIPFSGPQLTESLEKLTVEERLGAVVVTEAMLSQASQAFWADQFAKLGISTSATQTPFGLLFPASDLTRGPE
jgi:hypothetical protein